MPCYCYTPKKGRGKIVERLYPMGEAPKEIVVDGRPYERNIAAEHTSRHVGDIWPIYSEAAGVLPTQVKEATENWRKAGVPTEFTPDGRAVFRDPAHRRAFLKKAGLVDQRSFI